jgi:hypothetical protein
MSYEGLVPCSLETGYPARSFLLCPLAFAESVFMSMCNTLGFDAQDGFVPRGLAHGV